MVRNLSTQISISSKKKNLRYHHTKTATQFLLTFAPFIHQAKPILGDRIMIVGKRMSYFKIGGIFRQGGILNLDGGMDRVITFRRG